MLAADSPRLQLAHLTAAPQGARSASPTRYLGAKGAAQRRAWLCAHSLHCALVQHRCLQAGAGRCSQALL